MVLTFETRHLVWGEFRELGDHWGLPQLAQKAIPKKKKKQRMWRQKIPEANRTYKKGATKAFIL